MHLARLNVFIMFKWSLFWSLACVHVLICMCLITMFNRCLYAFAHFSVFRSLHLCIWPGWMCLLCSNGHCFGLWPVFIVFNASCAHLHVFNYVIICFKLGQYMLYNNKQQQSLIELQISNICSKSGLALQIASNIYNIGHCVQMIIVYNMFTQKPQTSHTHLNYHYKYPCMISSTNLM